mmetsp:Transcript_13760/g.32734  ORF Transcript_13760/g.32734 Transcript_13760/m.32734 type:complete len:90 (+) Transcript_13760:658-927(+)
MFEVDVSPSEVAVERYWFDNGHYHCRGTGAEGEKYEKKKSRSGDERKHIIPTFFSLSLTPMIYFEAAVLWVEDLTIRQICVNIVLGLCI